MDEFNMMILNLKSIEIKFDDEDQTLLLIMSLTNSYEVMSDTQVYGGISLLLKRY